MGEPEHGVAFRALGPLDVLVAGRAVTLGSAKLRLTLAALLVHANAVVSADRLVDILWGDEPPATATSTVQSLVYRLRRLLTAEPGGERVADVLVTRAPGYLLRVEPGQYDVARFEQLVAEARRATDPTRALAALDEGLALWRGAAFEEVAFDDFARTEATRLEELRFTAIEDRIEAKLRLGHHAELVAELEQAVAANPVRERVRAQLMLALYRSGREVEALNTYQHYRLYLAEELGLEPSAGLHHLEEQILQHDPVLDWARPGSDPAARPVELASSLPTGTVTFLFTDLEESTRLWQEHPQAMHQDLARHDAILREVIESHAGRVVKTTGDGVHAAFATPSDAVEAAVAAQLAISGEAWSLPEPLRVRIGIHTGPAELRDGDYYGTAVNRAARLMGAGHGQQILVSHATERLVRDDLAEDRELVDLGVHRLRDVSTAERIFQVLDPELPEQFPPLRTLDGGASLYVPATSFLGRADELTRLGTLVARPGTVTLVGTGGVGKTRLAIELAVEVGHRFRDGLAIIDLAPVGADAVPATVAAGLGLVRRGRRSFRDSIVGWLSRKQFLLVVDNCEHVLASVAAVVRDIAKTSSDVTVLCTSRQPLGFPGETIVSVEPLALPSSDDPDALESSPAVRLFADRAAAARSGAPLAPEQLAVVAQICRRLDGIPLALELAAARARSMSLNDLLAHLDLKSSLLATPAPDHPRHRTLFSAIEWSYDLLTPESRAIFERLSVFSGSWTVAAATSVCAEDETEDDVLALLADLADRSMIVVDFGQPETRYRMLGPLRDFAADRLAMAGATEQRRARHAEFYGALAERAEPALRTADEAHWIAEIAADFGNLQAAHVWAVDNAEVDFDARLLVALWNYGLQRLSAEYFSWVEEAIEKLSFEHHGLLAELHGIAALAAWLRGDLRQSMRSCRAAFEAEQRLTSGISVPARMAIVVASAYAPPGTPALEPIAAEVPTRFLEVVEWSRAGDDPFWLVYSMVTGSLGMVMTGEYERAARLAGRALRDARRSGCPTSIAWALFAVATALEPSDTERAEQLLDEAVRTSRAVDGRLLLGLVMSLQATLQRRLGRPLDAVPRLLELIDHWDRLGDLPQLWHAVREAALCLNLLGEDLVAVRLLAAVERIELVMPLLPIDRVYVAETCEQLRGRLGEEAFVAESADGTEMVREEAVELAVRTLTQTRESSLHPQ